MPDQERLKDQLHQALLQEISSHNFQAPLKSLYFGGGTPSLYGPERISDLLQALPLAEEVTLEVNPDGLTETLVKAYRQAGVNRISMGVQSFDTPQLVKLGRTHGENEALEAVYKIKNSGIDNLSIDLMYDLPGQTLEAWEKTLEIASKLPIEHLSLYNLTLEPRTVFYKHKERLKKELPSPEISLEMYRMAQSHLVRAGLEQYEISAFAKPGFYSKHNTGYWLGRPFYGLGPSAFSYVESKRFSKIAHLNRYCKAIEEGSSPIDFEELLPPEKQERELFLIQLRLMQGAFIPTFKEELSPLIKEGLLTLSDTVKLTSKGIVLYDSIAASIV